MKNQLSGLMALCFIGLLSMGLSSNAIATSKTVQQRHLNPNEVIKPKSNLYQEAQKDNTKLDGDYKMLMNEDKALPKEEQTFAKANINQISPAEQQKIDQDETTLKKQIDQDDHRQ